MACLKFVRAGKDQRFYTWSSWRCVSLTRYLIRCDRYSSLLLLICISDWNLPSICSTYCSFSVEKKWSIDPLSQITQLCIIGDIFFWRLRERCRDGVTAISSILPPDCFEFITFLLYFSLAGIFCFVWHCFISNTMFVSGHRFSLSEQAQSCGFVWSLDSSVAVSVRLPRIVLNWREFANT